MRTRNFIAALIVVATQGTAGAAPTLADAQHAYYRGQYGRSLALFETLAAAQDAEAAECAGFMLLQGGALFGDEVPRDVERARSLLLQAARAGRRGAGFLLNMIERTD